jgi:hypothetical protein
MQSTGAGFASGLVIAMLCGTAPANADWVEQPIGDHLRGRIGIGATVGGMLDDGRGVKTGALSAYCADNSTVVNVEATGIYFGSSSLTVRYSVDGGPVQTTRWDYCVGGGCVGLWGGQGIPFLKALFDKRELKMVFERRFAQPVNATFRIAGAKEGLQNVGEKCGWLPKPPAGK